MAEIIRFQTNVPVEVALKYKDGRQVEGRFGDQVMYTCTDDRIMYVPPIVSEKLNLLEIKKGQPFLICKTEKQDGRRKGIVWTVERCAQAPAGHGEYSAPAQLPAPIPQQPVVRPAAAASAPPTPPIAQNAPGHVNGSSNGHAAAAAAPNGGYGVKLLALALQAAIEAAHGGEQFAATRNYSLRFTSEDIRAMALTIFIQGARDNGGARWQM